MRFLQIEWHNHERARNSWDIERAEMKAKIAKQEGDCRSARKLTEILDRQVRMLEKALKQERAKNKAIAAGEQPPPTEEEVKKEWNGKIGVRLKIEHGMLKARRLVYRLSQVHIKWTDPSSEPSKSQDKDHEDAKQPQGQPESHRESQRERSKMFLEQCVNELSYLLQPPSHPPVPHQNPQPHNGAEYPPDMPPSMAEAYMHQQQQSPQVSSQQSRRNVQTGVSHLPSLPNHNPPHSRSQTEYYQPARHQDQQQQQQQPHNPSLMQRQSSHQIQQTETMHMPDSFQQPHEPLTIRNPDDELERVTHSFDSHGRQMNAAEEYEPSRSILPDDANGWNFDDSNTILETPPDLPSQRHDVDSFPNNTSLPAKSPPRTGLGHRRKSSGAGSHSGSHKRKSDGAHEGRESSHGTKGETSSFKVRFALRSHLDVVRSVIFTGGGSPSEPEICTSGDDGTVKRWIIPATYSSFGNKPQQSSGHDLDIQSYFTHRGHEGVVTCLSSCPASASFSTGGRALGDGWIFSGGQDTTIQVWERGRVDPKATLDGHTDAVWAVCVLPGTISSVLGHESSTSSNHNGSPTSTSSTSPTSLTSSQGQTAPARDERILLASGSADATVKVWAVSAPPNLSSPSHSSSGSGNRRGVGGSRRHSVTSGSGFPSSPQPSTASGTPFHHSLVHSIEMGAASPTSICPLGAAGETFVVAYADASALVFDTKSGEQIAAMASQETYDGTANTAVNSVVVANASGGADTGGSVGGTMADSGRAGMAGGGSSGAEEGEGAMQQHGATGNSREGGVEGTIITGHEDRFVRFFDANSGMSFLSPFHPHPSLGQLTPQRTGQCTYSMLAHPSSISSLSHPRDGRWLARAGHDASLRFWSLERRSCVQEVTSHRVCRGEGVVCAVWSQDGRWVVSAGGDGVVKVFGR